MDFYILASTYQTWPTDLKNGLLFCFWGPWEAQKSFLRLPGGPKPKSNLIFVISMKFWVTGAKNPILRFPLLCYTRFHYNRFCYINFQLLIIYTPPTLLLMLYSIPLCLILLYPSLLWQVPGSVLLLCYSSVRYRSAHLGIWLKGFLGKCSSFCYSSVRYSSVRYSSVHYSSVRYSSVCYSSVRYSSVGYSSVRYSWIPAPQ